MAQLLCNGRPVLEVEVARSMRARSRGLLGRDGVATGLAIVPGSSVHTFGMRFAIDVAFVRRDGRVSRVVTMRPDRLGGWRPRTRWVLETEAGRLQQLGVRQGDRLELLGDVSR
jgi:uncharacterized membrane protein (UPF0127 family)